LASRTNWHTIEKCLDHFIQLLIDIAPRKNSIPNNYYEAKKVVSSLRLKSVKINCCQGGCKLYYKDDSELTSANFVVFQDIYLARAKTKDIKGVS